MDIVKDKEADPRMDKTFLCSNGLEVCPVCNLSGGIAPGDALLTHFKALHL